jgi:hypothetical protein
VLRWSAVALSVCLLLPGGYANAADQGITGKKLLLKSTPKFVLLSKDPSISVGANPVCPNADSSLTFDDGVNMHTFALPCADWSNSGLVFKYKNLTAPSGPSEVKVAKVKGGVVKVIGKGLGIPVPNGPATIDVVLNVEGIADRYCMSFTGTGDGSRFLVKDAPAASCHFCGNGHVDPGEQCDGGDAAGCPGLCQPDCTCPPAVCGNNVREGIEECDGTDATACPGACRADCACQPPCTGQLVGGFCWFLGRFGQSCDDVCTGLGQTCDPATITFVGSAGTAVQCIDVLAALTGGNFFGFQGCPFEGLAIGCSELSSPLGGGQTWWCPVPPTTCQASIGNGMRVCACF